jgi:hypothetical protein
MPRPSRRGPATRRRSTLNRRTALNLINGHDWGILDPDDVLAPAASDEELRALWREHGHTLLAWAAGALDLPDLVAGHQCDYTRHPYRNCHPRCKPASRKLWALRHFGPPGAA